MRWSRAWVLVVSILALNTMLTIQAAPAKVVDTTIDLPSGKAFYRDSGGKGVPIVLLHAGSGNSMLWEYQIPAFVNAGYRFIAINYRGVGGGLNNGVNSTALIDELVSKLQLDRFHLLGTAAGGGAALQYALAHPEKLRSLIVSNSIGNVQDREYVELGNRLRPPAFNQLPLEFRELGPSYRAANPDGVKRWLALSGAEAAAPMPAGNNAGPNAPPSGAGPGGPGGPGGGGPGPGGPGGGGANAVTWTKLEALKVPVLLMTGDADLYTPPAVLHMFAAHMKQAETAVITDSGHSSYWENPDIFNRTVLAFVSKH